MRNLSGNGLKGLIRGKNAERLQGFGERERMGKIISYTVRVYLADVSGESEDEYV